ncbi:MAG: hypothetical protein ALAOOOJD_04616 [bacterium]|nr:hypothetical protein [bacterium]
MIERRRVPNRRKIREKRRDVAVLEQYVFDETMQCFLRANFDENACARGVQRVQAFDELYRRGDLLRQQFEHLRHHTGAHRIKVTGDIRHDGEGWQLQIELLQNARQRLTCRRDDFGMKRVTHL